MIMSASKAPKKKGHPKFNVPNYGTKSRSRVKARWRKQRGVDNKKRVKLAQMGAEPTIGYRNPESIRGIRSNGRRAVLVHSVAEFRDAVSGEEAVDVILSSSMSRKKRLEISKMAQENKVHIANLGRASRPTKKEAAKAEKAKAKGEKKADKKDDKKADKKAEGKEEKREEKKIEPERSLPSAPAPSAIPAAQPSPALEPANEPKSDGV